MGDTRATEYIPAGVVGMIKSGWDRSAGNNIFDDGYPLGWLGSGSSVWVVEGGDRSVREVDTRMCCDSEEDMMGGAT